MEAEYLNHIPVKIFYINERISGVSPNPLLLFSLANGRTTNNEESSDIESFTEKYVIILSQS